MQITFRRFESEPARQDKSAATRRKYLSGLRDLALDHTVVREGEAQVQMRAWVP